MACSRLNRFYIPTRYPDAFPQGAPASQFFEADARQALTDAKGIATFAHGLRRYPDMDALNRFVDQLLAERGADLEFIVLFGSRARGDWSPGSDYDLLIGLCVEDERRLLDRMAAFSPRQLFDVEAFPYSRSEWRQMFEQYHPLLLEAMEDGVILWDRGSFAAMREQFHDYKREGPVEPWRNGWKIAGPAA